MQPICKNEPMKIVKVIGGLGNQMFQYALCEALRQRHPQERVLVDLSCFRGYNLHGSYGLDGGYEIDRIFGANKSPQAPYL